MELKIELTPAEVNIIICCLMPDQIKKIDVDNYGWALTQIYERQYVSCSIKVKLKVNNIYCIIIQSE